MDRRDIVLGGTTPEFQAIYLPDCVRPSSVAVSFGPGLIGGSIPCVVIRARAPCHNPMCAEPEHTTNLLLLDADEADLWIAELQRIAEMARSPASFERAAERGGG